MLTETVRATDPSLATPEVDVSVLDMLIVVTRRRWLIVKITFGMIAIAVVITLLLPNRYTATASILPPQQNGSSGSALMSQLSSLGSVGSLAGASLGGLKNPNDLQVALMKSRTVEDAMVDRFHLLDLYHAKRRSVAQSLLENAVKIDNGVKDGLITVAVTDRSAERAAAMANGYVDEYKKFSATLALTEASQRRLFFEQQLGQAKDNLANAEEDLKRTAQKTGLIQLDSQNAAVIQSVAQLHAQIVAKEVQIRGLRSFATSENPDLHQAEEELAALQAQEQKMGAASDGALDSMLIRNGKFGESNLEYVRKLRDVKYYQTIFDLLARQYEGAKIDEAKEGVLIQVVDRATVPDHHSSPKRTLIVLGAAVFGLFLGIAWALAADGYARLRNNPAERVRLDTLSNLLFRKKSQLFKTQED